MITAALSLFVAFIAGGGLISLITDGLKTAYGRIDAASPRAKIAIVWGLALAVVLIVRGFDLPGSLLGWLYFVLSVVVLGFIAQGWYRVVRAQRTIHTGRTKV